ncbi:1,2-phenylacetyl-CoA epoxidase subunit PaaD [Actinomadura keratinilytica]|uniref:1,2-phenylacetyl-CoA epoxidase subunit PaaD n=1 Tax=Actinomadura keratinilytica TaxID=547461 RepID=UPI0036107C28
MVTGDRVAASAVEAPAAAEARAAEARAVAETVTDPELPMLTLRDLGVLRDVRVAPDGAVQVTITPTYTGCPAVQTMRDDLRARLAEAGFTRVEVRTVLHPPWTTDMISKAGRRNSPPPGSLPGPGAPPHVRADTADPRPAPHRGALPRCGSPDTDELSRFGSTACKSLRRCRACREPFEHFKEI